MDTKNAINEHSRLKLKIYNSYLKAYVSIMKMVPRFKEIRIIEPFAGKGKSDNGEYGSAYIANEIIRKQGTDNAGVNKFKLLFNDKQFSKELKDNLAAWDNMRVWNLDADSFLNEVIKRSSGRNIHSLFFIDPWGYSQIKGSTYDKLFQLNSFEVLVFIPVSLIFRFIRFRENESQLAPIATFLSDMGIEDASSCKSIDDFTDKIVQAFKIKAKTEFVYCKKLKNKHANTQHSLFFITRNVLGAEKFLEALDKSENPGLFEYIDVFYDQRFQQELSGKTLTNTELFKIIIQHGYLPKNVYPYLKDLEDNNKLTVEAKDGKKRRKGTYCLENNSKRNLSFIFKK